MNRAGGRGYALLAVLGCILALSVLSALIAGLAERGIRDRIEADSRLDSEIELLSTEATVLYLLSTQRMTVGGLTIDEQVVSSLDDRVSNEELPRHAIGNEIRLDGTVYAGVGKARFALRSERAKISPTWAPPGTLDNLVKALGGDPLRSADYLAKLLDFQDEDSLPRLNGAEAEAYRQAGLPPPPNRPLTTPLELRGVLGWRDLLQGLEDHELLGLLGIRRVGRLDLNTASAEALQIALGLDEATATRLVQLRSAQPFVDPAAAMLAIGLPAEIGEQLHTFSGNAGDLLLWPGDGGPPRYLQWRMQPTRGGGAPWAIDYASRLAVPAAIDANPLEEPPAQIFGDPAAASP